MKSRTRKKSNKKALWITLLVVCLLLAAIGGTIAWLTAQDSLTNQFAVGNFNDPTTDPTKPGTEIPDEDKDPDAGKLSGHLYEPSWEVDNNKIVPGTTLAKDPYVGIGKDSEDAYVYVYVRNSAATEGMIYFKLNDGWEAVTGEATAVTVDTDDTGYEASGTGYYSSGLFKYTNGLTASNAGDSWTNNPVFDEVYVSKNADSDDLKPADGSNTTALKVTAMLHQKTSGDSTDLLSDAAKWAKEEAAKLKTENITTETP